MFKWMRVSELDPGEIPSRSSLSPHQQQPPTQEDPRLSSPPTEKTFALGSTSASTA